MGNRTAAERVVLVPGETAPGSEKVRIPVAARTLLGFRPWARSDQFPENGRIDYLGGAVELDMSPEDLHTHGTPKAALAAELFSLIAKPGRGYVFIDRTRVTAPEAELSVEPDLVVVARLGGRDPERHLGREGHEAPTSPLRPGRHSRALAAGRPRRPVALRAEDPGDRRIPPRPAGPADLGPLPAPRWESPGDPPAGSPVGLALRVGTGIAVALKKAAKG